MSQALVIKDDKRAKIKKLLPSKVNADRFINSAQMAVYTNPDLQECTQASLIAAVYSAAELGLDFIPTKGHAYLIPYNKKIEKGGVERWEKRATFMPGYRGFVHLATSEGVAIKIEARIVHSLDIIEIEYGSTPKITHKPGITIKDKKDVIIGVYAIAFLKDGSQKFEYMTKGEVEEVRSQSKKPDGKPWTKFWDERAKGVVIKRLCKTLPSPEKAELTYKAIEKDNMEFGLEDEVPPIQEEEVSTEKEIKQEPEQSKKTIKVQGDLSSPNRNKTQEIEEVDEAHEDTAFKEEEPPPIEEEYPSEVEKTESEENIPNLF